MFDPDIAARESGEGHLVPPAVTPLTESERRDLVAYSERKVAGYGRPRTATPESFVSEETDPATLCGILSGLVESTGEFFRKIPSPDAHQRLMLWDELTFMSLVIARIELVVLGLDFEAAKEKQTATIKGRKVVPE